MKGSGPRHERETIITFNEEEADAEIWTASDTVYRRLLKRLGMERLIEDGERHARFKCPKRWVRLPTTAKPRVNINPGGFMRRSRNSNVPPEIE